MPDRVVIDASVAIALVSTEVGSQAAQAAISAWGSSGTRLLVPSHFWIEVTNALVRGQRRAPEHVVEAFVRLDGLGLQTLELDRPTLLLAVDHMARSGLSAYDAVYLALAVSTDAHLATLDRRLADAAGDIGLLIAPGKEGRLTEDRTPYLPSRPASAGWAHSAIVGAHVAELRRKATVAT